MPTHFVKALGMSSRSQTLQRIGVHSENSVDVDHGHDVEPVSNEEYDEDLDIDTRMDAEAFPDEPEAILASTNADFDAGDVIGKVMAFINQVRMSSILMQEMLSDFINQVRMSSEGTREYLKELCVSNSLPPLELKLWCRTRWGSLSDCLRVVLEVQDASLVFLIIHSIILILECRLSTSSVFLLTLNGHFQLPGMVKNGLITNLLMMNGQSFIYRMIV